jgi:hypothetical protein
MQTHGCSVRMMRKTFPLAVISLSAFCTVGCGGSSTTTVTPTSVDPSSAMGGSGATSPDPGAGSPSPNPNPAPNPSPGPTGSGGSAGGGGSGGSPGPTPAGDFAWTLESSGRAEPVSAIWGSSAGDVWAVGGHGVVHSTGDGGWATVHEDANEEYQAVLGIDGWIFVGGLSCSGGVCNGGLVLASSDGGKTWTRQTIGSGVNGFSAVGATVYADSGDIYASNDHFATTTTMPLGWATAYGVFADTGAVYAYGGLRGAQIRRTTDDGKTWTTVYSGFSGSKSGYMNGLTRAGTTMLALANGCSVPACIGAIFRSVDGGSSWQQAAQPQDWVVGIWPTSETELFVGGTTLMRSRDAGATFDKVAVPVDSTILALWGVGTNELYAVGGDGTILHGKR